MSVWPVRKGIEECFRPPGCNVAGEEALEWCRRVRDEIRAFVERMPEILRSNEGVPA